MSSLADQKIINKYDVFMDARMREVESEPDHFLGISVTRNILEAPIFSAPTGSYNSQEANHRMIQIAIQQFYEEFDVNLYNSWEDNYGILTKVIWGKFRTLQEVWRPLRDAAISTEQSRAREARLWEISQAHIKNQAKERQQMLRLGGGDLELGRKKFVERMHKQKEVKLLRLNTVSPSGKLCAEGLENASFSSHANTARIVNDSESSCSDSCLSASIKPVLSLTLKLIVVEHSE